MDKTKFSHNYNTIQIISLNSKKEIKDCKKWSNETSEVLKYNTWKDDKENS